MSHSFAQRCLTLADEDIPMDIQAFRKKYGTHGLGTVIKEFIRRAPEFSGDVALAKMIGEMMADLEGALESLPDTRTKV